MNIHEYQAKEILNTFDVPILKGQMVESPEQARTVAKNIGGTVWAVKAQIHAGGRGEAGGVKIAKSIDEVEQYAKDILGKTLVTKQTGPSGKKVYKIFVEEGCSIQKELYLSLLLDPTNDHICIMASTEGGMDIETVKKTHPNKIFKINISSCAGLQAYQARELAFRLGLSGSTFKQGVALLMKLYKVFVKQDCSLLEINPLVITQDQLVIPLDAKMSIEDNALYRQKNILSYRDLSEEEPSETEAKAYDLSFIKLDGTIGCLVNGAGLAMATMDIIKLHGSAPANFLDVGGGASREKVAGAFKIILKDTRVKGILVNIFGGIMKCDIIAKGILEAAKNIKIKVPLVVRLEGTNAQDGLNILKKSNLNIQTTNSLDEAARKVIELSQNSTDC